jgi:hypothetical protein
VRRASSGRSTFPGNRNPRLAAAELPLPLVDRQVEGVDAFDARQRFSAVVAALTRQRPLSRFVYLAEN